MSDKQKAILAWILFGLIVFSAVGQLIFNLASHPAAATLSDILSSVIWSLGPIVFAGVGALIISRKPRNVIGLLLILPALVFAIPAQVYIDQFSTAPADPTLPLFGALWFGAWGWLLLIMPVLFILVLFPTGQPLTPRWRWPIYLGLGMSLVFFLFVTFAEEMGPVEGDPWRVSNPIGFIRSTWFDEYLLGPWFVLLPLLTIVCASSIFLRFHRAGAVEREQIKWLFYAGAFFALVYVPTFLNSSMSDNLLLNLLFVPALLTIPIAIGIAILRYRLFDIDIIIRRTLVYGLLTALLVLIYFGTVLVAQSAFVAITGQESPLAIVISTLVIAALFNPLRKRLQTFIDRRFFRQQYDRQQILAEFAQAVRNEVEIASLTADLQRAIQETLQPESLSLWLVSESSIRAENTGTDVTTK